VARRRLILHISGLREKDLRRQRSNSHWVARGLLFKLLLIGVLAWGVSRLVPEPSLAGDEQIVHGGRVLLIQDTSGSMTQYEGIVKDRLAALRAAGMYSEVACRLSNTEFPDFVDCVERLARREDADGVYVFADFDWDWTEDGLRRVKQAVESTGMRVYLETVSLEPNPKLMRVAEQSGGGVIHTTRPNAAQKATQ
jgi:hypothetical protein